MSDLLTLFASYESDLDKVATASETLADLRASATDSFAGLVAAATESDDEQIRKVAEGIVYCDDEIEKKTHDEDEGQKALRIKVRNAALALREAARRGDARAAEADLAAAEDELAEVTTDIKLLRKARREHVKQLNALLKGIV